MQRLRRGRDERGAIAVVVALLLAAMLTSAALAIDVGAIYTDKQQLQTGADAAALAVAQDCARDHCDLAAGTTQELAAANINDGDVVGTVVALDEAAGSVTVRTETVTQHWFAPLIGIDQTDVAARASARWGYPAGGTAVLPLAFSWCELAQQLGITVLRNPITNEVIGLDIPEAGTAEANVYLTKSSETTCTGPSGNLIPGGFGWLVPSPSQCAKANLTIDGWAASDTGNSPPSICSAEEFASWVGKTILIPVFDDAVGNGSSGKYKVFGFAAFKLTSYYFAGQYKPLGTAPCSGNERCVRGKFVRFVDLGEDFQISPDAPKLGAVVVALTE